MKPIKTLCLPLLTLVLFSGTAHAQFFKQILNTVKQTAQGRADDKARQATNTAADKTVDAVKKKKTTDSAVTTNDIDTSAVSRVLGGFVKAAEENPNDTDKADLLKKALGNIASGGVTVSKEDSAKAIAMYKHASGGRGFRIEYIININTGSREIADTSVGYITESGEGRTESKLPMPGITEKFIVLGRIDNPTFSINLNTGKKTYGLNVIDTALINDNHMQKFSAAKVGQERVNGYLCTHAKLTTTTGIGMFKNSGQMDIWVSTEVPGYALMQKAMVSSNVSPGMMNALKKAGCPGMLVKMTAGNKKYTSSMNLESSKNGNFPASLFTIPSDYTGGGDNLVGSLF